MKKNLLSIIVINCILFSMLSGFGIAKNTLNFENEVDNNNFVLLNQLSTQSNSNTQYQDGRYLKKLEWYSPHGEQPGTYEDYLKWHPITSSGFSQSIKYSSLHVSDNQISIIVDEELYPNIVTSLNQYINDLELEGNSVYLQTVTGGTPEEIKVLVKTRYYEGCTSFVFIGDITAAWAEVSESVFPSDLFYMDLDGNWVDNDEDGDYETHTAGSGDMGPEVYIGRIYANTLNYDTEANMVNDYLSKAHAFRTGELTQEWHGLEYVDEDWYSMDVHLNLVYGDEVVRHDYGYLTTGEDYLNQMDLGQHFVQVCAHSYSGGHHFGKRPTESASYAHIYVYSPINRTVKLLLGSDDGIKIWMNQENVYTNDRYGGWSKDAYEVDVELKEGWNQLLCKVSQDGGSYRLSACITNSSYQNFDDLMYQISNPDTHGMEAEYIRSWLLNGFHQDIPDNFWSYLTTNYLGVDEYSINPQDGDTMGGETWTTFDSEFPFIDLNAYNSSDYGVTYAFARIYAESETSCQLWMGYDDGARIWLNEDEILYDNRYGGFEADMTKINVLLNAGENKLLIKISEWMGDHGFSARFCHSDGSLVEGLTYDPEMIPINYIGTWLINGPYENPDKDTRLSKDYLSDEGNVTPSEGDSAPFGTWDLGIGNGCPFGLDSFFDHGDWVFSQDIQDRDPPVLFYNLFACGPGRFTDENYLAGAYIFNTTYGLITIASSKSGSMLNFADFTQPLSEGKSIGDSFRLWFEKQAPYEQWEKEWYYGMVICGDPTLYVIPQSDIEITKPENAIYIQDKKILPFFKPVIFGKITIEVDALNDGFGIDRVEFYIDEELIENITSPPYQCMWDERVFFKHKITVVAHDIMGENTSRQLIVWKFF